MTDGEENHFESFNGHIGCLFDDLDCIQSSYTELQRKNDQLQNKLDTLTKEHSELKQKHSEQLQSANDTSMQSDYLQKQLNATLGKLGEILDDDDYMEFFVQLRKKK